MLEKILHLYGLNPAQTVISSFGEGLINHTWKVITGTKSYILQKVNTEVFKRPSDIDTNLSLLKDYLDDTAPDYLFVAPVRALSGNSLLQTSEGFFRLSPFVEGSQSLNALNTKEEAYEAALQFGKFSALLAGFDASKLQISIPDFHQLSLRYEQLILASKHANRERLKKAGKELNYIHDHKGIVQTYLDIVADKEIPLRVIHHDTKISNVLFNQQHQGICVIDLDTVMPGYFISDVGDMMRTYLCAANEEETDLNKIIVRGDFIKAIYDGYMENMGAVLSSTEQKYFMYAGKFMIYMQAIRFLTDYLQNDIYYSTRYEDHNFNRAKNQIALLKAYFEAELTTPLFS